MGSTIGMRTDVLVPWLAELTAGTGRGTAVMAGKRTAANEAEPMF